ncbi:MAG: AbrB/MazE/SpoVT family DNA-binding domain-containing protein [Candidatus Thorarchaeota archaeon]
MNGETTKYYKFEKSGSGRVTIPISLAKSLNWSNGDELGIIIEIRNGNKGLFLWKREKET